jgi:hypothetical protein
MNGRIGILLLGLAIGCKAESDVLAPPPDRLRSAPIERPPALPPTVVDMPLLIDLTTAVDLMEQALPRRLGNIDQRIKVPGKKRAAFAYGISRSPFEINVKGDTFQIAATIRYQGRGWYNPPIGPEVGGSCGSGGKEPRARVVISTRPEINRDWQLVAQPKLSYLGPLTKTERDQCEVTFLKIDVTGRVLDAARGAIRGQFPKLAQRLKALDVRSEVEKVWNEIQQPIRLADSVWLMLRPEGVRLGRLSGSREMLGGTIGIQARPKIETGAKPAVALVPLPALDPAGEDTGLNLLTEGRFDYVLIGANLTKAVAGKTIKVPGGTIGIKEIGAYGIGGGRLALGVRFGGTSSGQIYFVGTPQYEDSTGRIVVPDLDYDAATTPLLVKSLAWLKADQIRDFLRAKAAFPSAEAMERLSSLAATGMNRELVPGVFLSTTLNRTEIVRLLPRVDALYLQAHATGNAALHVTDGFFARLRSADSTGPAVHPVPGPPTGR